MRKIVVGDTEKTHIRARKRKQMGGGCKHVHSCGKMNFLCLLKVAKNIPFRDVVNELVHMHDEWVDESEPD